MIREWYPLTSNLPREISPLVENGLRHKQDKWQGKSIARQTYN